MRRTRFEEKPPGKRRIIRQRLVPYIRAAQYAMNAGVVGEGVAIAVAAAGKGDVHPERVGPGDAE